MKYFLLSVLFVALAVTLAPSATYAHDWHGGGWHDGGGRGWGGRGWGGRGDDDDDGWRWRHRRFWRGGYAYAPGYWNYYHAPAQVVVAPPVYRYQPVYVYGYR